jgi:predicted DNA-binding protein (MmcQ/YjbR family)
MQNPSVATRTWARSQHAPLAPRAPAGDKLGAMGIDWVRRHCLSLSGVAEVVQFDVHLAFQVAGKTFAVTNLEPGMGNFLTVKATPEEYAELVELPGVVPAPYAARNHWVGIETEDTLPAREMKRLIDRSYAIVFATLPKKTQAKLAAAHQRKH